MKDVTSLMWKSMVEIPCLYHKVDDQMLTLQQEREEAKEVGLENPHLR